MNEESKTLPETAATALVEMALEERLGGAVPPDLTAKILAGLQRADAGVPAPRRPRARLLAAALLLAGAGVVTGVTVLGRPPAAVPEPQPAQEPRPPRTGALDAAAFFPLLPGTRWQYEDLVDGAARARTVLAAVAVQVGEESIVQLAEWGQGEVLFSFWSHDPRGVHRHGTDGMDEDPVFQPIGQSTLELPSPAGAHASWQIERMPGRKLPRGVAAGRRRSSTPADAVAGTATLLGMEEELKIGERTWRCLHVRVLSDGEAGAVEEHSWYARGVGLVRRTKKAGEQLEQVRELRAFQSAEPLPDRGTVLAAELRERATGARWLELPVTEETVWTLRTSFALATEDGATKVWRLTGGRAFPFDPEQLESYVELARQEDFGPRMEGLFPQRVTHGLCALALRLHALQPGFVKVDGIFAHSIEIGRRGTNGQVIAQLSDADGNLVSRTATVRLEDALPVQVQVK